MMEILELYMCREGKNFRRYIKRECLTVRLWTFQFFSLHCVFRFFFPKYFYLYNYERQWKEDCTRPWSDFGISVKATAILEVFETFEFSLMAPSHQLQSPVDSPFTIFLGMSLSFCLSVTTVAQTLAPTPGLLDWLQWQSSLSPQTQTSG